MEDIKRIIKESIDVKKSIIEDENILKNISGAVEVCIKALKSGKKILLAGNGGSAADAQHIAGELVNKFMFDRPGLPAIALTTNASVITAISNDNSFNNIFSRQVESIGNEGDVLILISTSGRSANILKAAMAAHEKNITVIGLTGKSGGDMVNTCDIIINVPSDVTPRIQECHELIGHIICQIIERKLFA